MTSIRVNPELPILACERARLDPFALAGHFSKLISGDLLDESMGKSRKFARYLPFWA